MMTDANKHERHPLMSLQDFEDAEKAALTLSSIIETRLREGLARRGQASLLVSGGSSPRRLYQHLSNADLDWPNIHVVLADERWVEPGMEGSNESFLKSTLMVGRASQARFVGLKTPHAHPSEALAELESRLEAVPAPFDAIVLGMGPDGHTLSWFPEADGLGSALAKDAHLVTAITAQPSEVTGPFVERATLTHKALQDARYCALLISGAEKRRVWLAAQSPGQVASMPVRSLLRDKALDLQTYWWP